MAFPGQTDTGVVATDDPSTSQGAEPNTLDNLDARVAEVIDSQTSASTGDATPATTPVPGEQEAAPATPAEGTSQAEADEAKMHRVSQENAKLRIAITKFGVDPDSDLVEQINAGVITVDDITRARQPVTPTAAPQASTPTAPEIPLDQQIDNLQSIVNAPIPERGYSSEDVQARDKAFMGVIAGQVKQIQNITQSQEQKEQQEQAHSMVAATNVVFNEDVLSDLMAEIPEDVREIGSKMFLGATDIENIELIKSHGKEKALTADGYRFSANKVAPEMKQFIQAVYKAGQDSTNPNPIPPTHPIAPRTNVQPLRPGGGPTPAPPVDKDKFAIENLSRNVDEELAAQEGRV